MKSLDADGDFSSVQGEALCGPRGGNLNNPNLSPQNKGPLNAVVREDGSLQLHRKDGFVQTACVAVKNEQPWHRMAAYMMLAGRTASEIGMAAGVTAQTVSILRSQQWFQELLAVLANNEGDEVIGILKGEALNSVMRLVQLRDNAEKESVQLSAASTLLEHAHGKAVTRIETKQMVSTFSSEQEEYENIQNELRVLRQKNSIPTESVMVNSPAGDAVLSSNEPEVKQN